MKKLNATWVSGWLGIVLGLTGCASSVQEIDVHPDDMQHPLSLYPGSGLSGLAQPDDAKDGDTWSGMFGSFMPCVAHGDGPIEITGVDWSSTPNLEPLSVDVYVRTFVIGDENPIGQLYGTPEHPSRRTTTPFNDKFVSMSVERPCIEEGDPPPDGSIDEIVFSVKGRSSGAHLRDIQFTYSTPDGKEHVVQNDWDFYLCGPAVAEEIGCR